MTRKSGLKAFDAPPPLRLEGIAADCGRSAVKSALLNGAGDIVARLTSYPRGFEQRAHAHDASAYSHVLMGALVEASGADEVEVDAGYFALRPCGAKHAVRFGPTGAVILSISTISPSERVFQPRPWQGSKDEGRTRSLLALIFKGGPELLNDGLWDLVSSLDEEGAAPAPRSAPIWLRRARERLIEEPDQTTVGSLAREAGVHRVHFSRAFENYYGRPPSLFRKACMVSRSVMLILGNGCELASAAHEAGFVDQSHFTRSMKQLAGLTPGSLRNLFN